MTDQLWVGLEQIAEDRFSVDITATHGRHDGQLYGGSGLVFLTAAMARRTGRKPLWLTTQFVSSAPIGDTLDCRVEVLAEGRLVSQVRMTASVGDQLVLAGLGAAGVARDGALHYEFGTMPDVIGPDEATVWGTAPPGQEDLGSNFGPRLTAEFRRARGADGDFRLWVRMSDHPQSVESIAYLADIVPGFVVRAAGRAGWGSSLDNSIRFGPAPECDWVLLDVIPYFADSGFVHGAARVWSPDGVLLAVASQTARAKLFD